MGCGEECPYVPGLERDDWPLRDPKNRPVEDVRAILTRLPIHTADGLGHIEFSLDERLDPEAETVDPYLGILGNETFPGVYSGEWLGMYRSGDRSNIRLFG